jgi:hypothetical protein
MGAALILLKHNVDPLLAETRFISMDAAPIYLELFGRLHAGMHNRIGEKVFQDFCLSRGGMQKFLELMEGEWLNDGVSVEKRVEVAQLVVFIIVGSYAGKIFQN